MAFNLFKKKEMQYPADEKAEVLGPDFPEVSDLPPLPEGEEDMDMGMEPLPEEGGEDFGEMSPESFGFRSQNEMMPPQMPQQRMVAPPMQRQVPMQPALSMEMEEEMPQVKPAIKSTPHIYIRVSKYKDVMDAITELSQKIQETKNDVEEIHEIEGTEAEKLREAAEVILKIEELLKYLETTFRTPEE